jgi:hypothetical protein
VDIQYPVKELCREMSPPTVGARRKLKRLGRYLKGRPRVVSKFWFQGRQGAIDGHPGSGWAGCKKTAKPTSGGAIMVGAHLVKSWSSTQKSITLSSGEAELVAAVKTCTEVLGMVGLMEDWGAEHKGNVHVDSSAAIGTASRKGAGKMRHVRIGHLWIQEKAEDEDISMKKILGEENPADCMTKGLSRRKIDQFMEIMNQEAREGRAEKGLKAKEDGGGSES